MPDHAPTDPRTGEIHGPTRSRLDVPIRTQPDDVTCGPACLHAVYGYLGLDLPLQQVIADVPQLDGGGTLGALLGIDALRRGFEALLVTYNLRVFDPTWFANDHVDVAAKLRSRWKVRSDPKLRRALEAYILYLELGGRLRFEDLTPSLLRRVLDHHVPILTALSATYLYASARERHEGGRLIDDDVGGDPQGHFVVLTGYDREMQTVSVSDPLHPNPLGTEKRYDVDVRRLLNAILLGILTHDANMLMLQPRAKGRDAAHADPAGRR